MGFQITYVVDPFSCPTLPPDAFTYVQYFYLSFAHPCLSSELVTLFVGHTLLSPGLASDSTLRDLARWYSRDWTVCAGDWSWQALCKEVPCPWYWLSFQFHDFFFFLKPFYHFLLLWGVSLKSFYFYILIFWGGGGVLWTTPGCILGLFCSGLRIDSMCLWNCLWYWGFEPGSLGHQISVSPTYISGPKYAVLNLKFLLAVLWIMILLMTGFHAYDMATSHPPPYLRDTPPRSVY